MRQIDWNTDIKMKTFKISANVIFDIEAKNEDEVENASRNAVFCRVKID